MYRLQWYWMTRAERVSELGFDEIMRKHGDGFRWASTDGDGAAMCSVHVTAGLHDGVGDTAISGGDADKGERKPKAYLLIAEVGHVMLLVV